MTTTLKLDWDDDTIAAVRPACLVVAGAYESMGHGLPGAWNLADARLLLAAAEDIRAYIESREQVKQDQVARVLYRALANIPEQETSS
jgi:hypothetical protein